MRLIIFLIFFPVVANAQQDHHWWNEKHEWDGVSHWSNYLTFSPGYFGPNALPVPRLLNGLAGNKASLQVSVEGHSMPGDNTFNTFGRFYFPVLAQKIALEFHGVPFEYFELSPEVRDERAARDFDAKGTATGDFYFGTVVQLVHEKRFPDVAFSMACRTASGGNLDNARYTDAPGYFFDVSFGKNLLEKGEEMLRELRLYGMGGFYVWQTNMGMYPQNDAAMFGAGISMLYNNWKVETELTGYAGYIGNRDKPVVARAGIERQFINNGIKFHYQKGIHDVYYHTLNISYIRYWER